MCFKYLFNCKYTAFENVNPNNFLKKLPSIQLLTSITIIYMQPSIDLQKLAIIIIQRYEQIRAISYTFSYNILNKSPMK